MTVAGGAVLKRSFAPVVDAATRLLVLGSLPGDRSLAEQRYYAHPQNQFWQLIGPAAGDPDVGQRAYDARLATLRAAHIGLWDVVAAARRPGSSDAAIRDLVGNNLRGLIETLPVLRAIAFNGATAFREGTRQLGATDIPLIALPSSSPLHTIGFAAKLPAWAALTAWLGQRPDDR